MTRPFQPRIYRVSYRSNINNKLVKVLTKVPYSGAFAMTETLTRALATGQIGWFRVEPAKPNEITEKVRDGLQRWPEALRASSQKTGVNWLT